MDKNTGEIIPESSEKLAPKSEVSNSTDLNEAEEQQLPKKESKFRNSMSSFWVFVKAFFSWSSIRLLLAHHPVCEILA